METSPQVIIPTLASLPVELQDMIKPYLSCHDLTLCARVCKSWHDIFIDFLWHAIETNHRGKCYNVLKLIQEFKKTPEGASSLFTRHIHRIRKLSIWYTSLQELFCHPQLQLPMSSSITGGSNEDDPEGKKDSFGLVTSFRSLLSLTDLEIYFNEDLPPPSSPSLPRVSHGPSLFGTGPSVVSVSTEFSEGTRWTGFGASTTTTTTPAPATTPTTLNLLGTTVIGEETPLAPTIMNFRTFPPVLPLEQSEQLDSVFGSRRPTGITATDGTVSGATAAAVAGGGGDIGDDNSDGAATFSTTAVPADGLGSGSNSFGGSGALTHVLSFSKPPPVPKPTLIDISPLLRILEQSKDLKRFTINLGPLLYRNQIKDVNRIMASLPTSLETLVLQFGFSLPSSTGSIVSDTDDSCPSSSGPEKEDRVFKNLKSLSIDYPRSEDNDGNQIFELIMNLMDQCPKLEELNMVGFTNDLKCSEILKKNAKNWKTLIGCPGPLSADMIVQHCTGLANVRILGGTNFSSRHIQQLLCSAKNLKRVDLLPEYGCSDFTVVFMANEIVESEMDWVCLDLESFKCMIGGIPSPDLKKRSNGRPLLGEFHDSNRYTIQQSRLIQRKVLTQLGRLTKLREITLGLDNLDDDSWNHQLYWDDKETEGDYHEECDIQQNRQYACLSLSLEDGLDLLKDLKNMRRLRVDGMSVLLGEKEEAWMKENWLEYRKVSKDKFWTSRGLGMSQGTCAGCGPPQNQEIFFGGHNEFMEGYDFDWW